jgi:hypothetical protein
MVFDYDNYIDTFGSPFYLDSRLFASNSYLNPDIKDCLCYLFDSCLGLGYEYKNINEGIISWKVDYDISTTGNPLYTSYYTLTVKYGLPTQYGGGGNS